MARQDEILRSFLQHPIISSKYEITDIKPSITVEEGIVSDKAIVRSISTIVKNLEKQSPISDKDLQTQILQLLNLIV